MPFLSFQFHKGAIRTLSRVTKVVTCDYFNSIKVRLEHQQPRVFLECTPFQFHKGAIRTATVDCAKDADVYFNSIKVRLELLTVLKMLTFQLNFNSIKVRLELRKRKTSS